MSDTLAATDAAGILRFLTRRGVLTGDPGPLPELRADATPLEGVEMLRAPVAGVLVHHRAPGEWVDAGDPVATIVDPGAARLGTSRTELLAGTSGRVYGRVAGRFVRPGTVVSKIAGATALAGRAAGALLPD